MFNKISSKVVCYAQSSKYMIKNFADKASNHVKGDKKAQGILEYGLLFVLVALALMGPLSNLKDKISGQLNNAGSTIDGMNKR